MAKRKKQTRKIHVHSCGCYYDTNRSKWYLCAEARKLLIDWRSFEDMERYWNHFKELDK